MYSRMLLPFNTKLKSIKAIVASPKAKFVGSKIRGFLLQAEEHKGMRA